MEFDARTARLDRAVSVMTRATSDLLREVSAFDHEALWKADGATSMSSWLAGRYRVAWGTAREWVRVARALEQLPAIAEAYRADRLSWDQLRPLTRFAVPETDERWADRAPGMRPARLWQEARRHQRLGLRDAEEHHRNRYLSLRWDEELPVLWLDGMLPADEGAALETALNYRAQRLPADSEAVDPGGARLADALTRAAAGGEPATVVIHAEAGAIVGERHEGPWLAETEGGTRLALETVRRLACDADRVGARVQRRSDRDRPARPPDPGRSRSCPPAPRRCVPVPGLRAETVGYTPITWSTGPAAAERTSTTSCSCAGSTTASFTKAGGGPAAIPRETSGSTTRAGGLCRRSRGGRSAGSPRR